MILLYILIGILALAIIILFVIVFKRKGLVVGPGQAIIFESSDDEEWVIKKSGKQLITGIKQGNLIVKKSTI